MHSGTSLEEEEYDALVQVLHIEEKNGYKNIPFSEGCEIVSMDEEGNILSEAAVRQFKRFGTVIKRQYRCTSGPKKGRIVAKPSACGQRKDPKKVRHGKKVARLKKGVRIRKSTIAKRKSVSRMVTKMNKRLSGTKKTIKTK